jgi:hypothetical protein
MISVARRHPARPLVTTCHCSQVQASKTNVPLITCFFAWNGPNLIPQSDIEAALAGAAGTDLTITVATPITGMGDQAEYLETTGTESAVIHLRLLRL